MDAVLSRRSIRKYTPEQVPEEVITKLLEAAMSAPSAGNQQPWHFVIIDDRKIFDQIQQFHPYSNMLKEASVAILVCGDVQLEKFQGYWVQDCSAATENILIAARQKVWELFGWEFTLRKTGWKISASSWAFPEMLYPYP